MDPTRSPRIDPFLDDPSGHAHHLGPCWNVGDRHRAGRDEGAVSDGHAVDDDGADRDVRGLADRAEPRDFAPGITDA